MRARLATTADASAIAVIYNRGIEERVATFETTLRSERDVLAWLDGIHHVVVVEDDERGVVAFARTSEYRPRECYRGIHEVAVYADRTSRRRGAGLIALEAVCVQARAAGVWKLVSRIFVDNEASRALIGRLGFREVGIYERHAKLDGVWRDVVIVEKLLEPPAAETADVLVAEGTPDSSSFDLGEPPTPRALPSMPVCVEPPSGRGEDDDSDERGGRIEADTTELEAVTVEIHAVRPSALPKPPSDLEWAPTVSSAEGVVPPAPAGTAGARKRRRRGARRRPKG